MLSGPPDPAYRALLRCPWCDLVLTTHTETIKLAQVPEHPLPERQAADVGGRWICRGSGKDVEPMGWRAAEAAPG